MSCSTVCVVFRPFGLQEIDVPTISRQSVHKGGKVVSPTHRPCLLTHFCHKLSRSQGHSAARRIISLKNLKYRIGNGTRDLPACSKGPQITALPNSNVVRINEFSQVFHAFPQCFQTADTMSLAGPTYQKFAIIYFHFLSARIGHVATMSFVSYGINK